MMCSLVFLVTDIDIVSVDDAIGRLSIAPNVADRDINSIDRYTPKLDFEFAFAARILAVDVVEDILDPPCLAAVAGIECAGLYPIDIDVEHLVFPDRIGPMFEPDAGVVRIRLHGEGHRATVGEYPPRGET